MNIVFKDNKAKYIQIYEQIAEMINSNHLKANEKLPSKRELSLSLNVSLNTIINAYDLLLDEGYIYSLEKKGYYVTNQPTLTIPTKDNNKYSSVNNKYKYDFSTLNVEDFNNQKWNNIIKNVLDSNEYINKSPLKGDLGLRKAILKHLYENKGISTNVENIIIGTGMEMFEYILSIIDIDLIILENPGFHKLKSIGENINKKIDYINLDNEGTIVPNKKGILYTTPFNQFPTGIKMSIKRKKELIQWANDTQSYIIEDDFDAEYRINQAPTTSIYSFDSNKVIFFSTFSTTLFPGLRISYALLPDSLINKYEIKYNGYSCLVSTFNQLILKEFINNGAYASHINKRKKKYLLKRNECIRILKQYDFIELDENKNYLSLLFKINKPIKNDFIKNLNNKGINIQTISNYDCNNNGDIFILGYTAISFNDIEPGIKAIIDEIKD